MEKTIRRIYEQATKLGACQLFTGEEKTLDDIIRLFLTPQGIEFCVKHNFPSLTTIRGFKKYGVEKYGIYIDAGEVTLKNPQKAVIIGKTSATVDCDSCELHKLVFMHKANGTVNASGWAVVRTEASAGCDVAKKVSEKAVML